MHAGWNHTCQEFARSSCARNPNDCWELRGQEMPVANCKVVVVLILTKYNTELGA